MPGRHPTGRPMCAVSGNGLATRLRTIQGSDGERSLGFVLASRGERV